MQRPKGEAETASQDVHSERNYSHFIIALYILFIGIRKLWLCSLIALLMMMFIVRVGKGLRDREYVSEDGISKKINAKLVRFIFND